MEELKNPSEQPYKEMIAAYLNVLLTRRQTNKTNTRDKSERKKEKDKEKEKERNNQVVDTNNSEQGSDIHDQTPQQVAQQSPHLSAARAFWTSEIKQELTRKFQQKALTSDELKQDCWLNEREFDNVTFLTRVLQCTAIKLTTRAAEHFFAKPQETMFVYADIKRLGTRQKDLNIATHATGMTLYLQSISIS